MKIAVYQGRFPVGAILDNSKAIIDVAHQVVRHGAHVLLLPECALSGYAPQDLLYQEDFKNQLMSALDDLLVQLPTELYVLLGSPYYVDDKILNALFVLHQGKIEYVYAKRALPNYNVFDEQRYFTAGQQPGVIEIHGFKCGLLICEDIWDQDVVRALPRDLDFVFSIHASPFEMDKREQRMMRVSEAVQYLQAPCIYAHQVSGQDELIFDGASFVMDRDAELLGVLPQFEEGLGFVNLEADHCELQAWEDEFIFEGVAELYQALVFSVREYVKKNHFKGVLLGLSGGIDSALTLVICVDALGADAVEAVLMPSRFTAAMSIEDAHLEADALEVKTLSISLESMFDSFLNSMTPYFEGQAWDVTEENMQARVRGMMLMALSNKSGKMVVTTSNKSEVAVGYGTLYGDMAGGFDVLKDVYKTDVYRLAVYRNQLDSVIPVRVLTRAPSAELRVDQKDQDTLPDYVVLDGILKLYVEDNFGVEQIVVQGFERSVVEEIIRMVNKAEYKRQQAPMGPKVSRRAFGDDWRMPVTK